MNKYFIYSEDYGFQVFYAKQEMLKRANELIDEMNSSTDILYCGEITHYSAINSKETKAILDGNGLVYWDCSYYLDEIKEDK